MSDDAMKQMAYQMALNMTQNANKTEQISGWITEADRETYVYGYTDLLKLDLRPQLHTITVPALILGAPFPSEEIALPNFSKQYEALKNKSIQMAPGGKHYIMFDESEWLYQQINSYLARYVE
jgi:pimeloyl-ACP methyl ester carboxylesterase